MPNSPPHDKRMYRTNDKSDTLKQTLHPFVSPPHVSIGGNRFLTLPDITIYHSYSRSSHGNLPKGLVTSLTHPYIDHIFTSTERFTPARPFTRFLRLMHLLPKTTHARTLQLHYSACPLKRRCLLSLAGRLFSFRIPPPS